MSNRVTLNEARSNGGQVEIIFTVFDGHHDHLARRTFPGDVSREEILATMKDLVYVVPGVPEAAASLLNTRVYVGPEGLVAEGANGQIVSLEKPVAAKEVTAKRKKKK